MLNYKLSLVLLAFAMAIGQQSPLTVYGHSGLGLNNIMNNVGGLTNSLASAPLNLVGSVPNVVNNAANMITKPFGGVLGGALSNGPLSAMSQIGSAASRLGESNAISSTLNGGLGVLNGIANGGLNSVSNTASSATTSVMDTASSVIGGLTSGLTSRLTTAGNTLTGGMAGSSLRNNQLAQIGGLGLNTLDGAFGAAQGLASGIASATGNSIHRGMSSSSSSFAEQAAMAAASSQEVGLATSGLETIHNGIGSAIGSAAASGIRAASDIAASAATAATAVTPVVPSGPIVGPIVGPVVPASVAENIMVGPLAPQQVPGRQTLATDALNNAQAESAIAGADMVAHSANNARSASLASNAYRQAKLASARDRVNIAGTVQNSARISDAAIATHDASTKAEDSLLGSELAVDSAATVLDSDAAYIPPVTNSLLRSLPYGRLGLRNIVPKPLTYPSVLLPDVWLNGAPVNYFNVPFRMPPYGIGPNGAAANALQMGGQALAGAAGAIGQMTGALGQMIGSQAMSYPINGVPIIGQPFSSYNGLPINGMFIDPSMAYLTNNMNGIIGSSILPVLANGQLEAQDEVAMANWIALHQQTGPGMAATYHGYGKLNPVPMLTGSVSHANLGPTTTIGTTYPIGSALVIEPRDSYFQDYIDNASSRQNFDEKQQ